MKFENLLRKQVDEQLKTWALAKQQIAPKKGWVNLIRTALGISSHRLAKKMGLSQSRILQIEKSEQNGTLTIGTLEKVAEVMGCNLVYALVPKTSLENIIALRAREIAEKRVARVSHTMELEAQGTDKQSKQSQIDELSKKLREGPSKKLWGDE